MTHQSDTPQLHTQPDGPWRIHGTSIYFANVAGGFDVRNCPDPVNLAKFIHNACNSFDALTASHAALSASNAALREEMDARIDRLLRWCRCCAVHRPAGRR